ncbi:MAG TPA: hypothetical protein VF894_16005 [Anaeromyxobacter sp.]
MERSREFLDGLRRELPVWQADGIVTPGAARALAVRYEVEPGSAPPADPARDRSGPHAAAAGVAVLLALAAALLASGIGDGVLLPLTALAAAFAATPLAMRGAALAPAAVALRTEGRVVFYAAAYALSFVRVADAARFQTGLASEGLLAALPPLLLAAAAVAAGIRRTDVDAHTRGEAMLLVATVAAFAAGLSLDTGGGTALVATMALAFLAVGRIVRGISWSARGPFVEGILLASLLVASHAFDVFPSIWIALGVAGSCLVGAALALIGFERRRTRVPAPAGAL